MRVQSVGMYRLPSDLIIVSFLFRFVAVGGFLLPTAGGLLTCQVVGVELDMVRNEFVVGHLAHFVGGDGFARLEGFIALVKADVEF